MTTPRNMSELAIVFRELLESEPEAKLFFWRESGREFLLTRGELKNAIVTLSDELMDSGYKPGDRVALLSESRPEWCIALMACFAAGLTVVPIDTKLTPIEVARLLEHSEPVHLFISKDCLNHVGTSPLPTTVLNGLTELGKKTAVRRHPVIPSSFDSLAILAYTSGTAGAPKGVMLTYGNLWFETQSLSKTFQSRRSDVLLSVLPLNHLLELSGGLLAAMFIRAKIVFANTLLPTEILDLMKAHKVTQMIIVPQFLDHFYREIQRQLSKKSKAVQVAFKCLLVISSWIPWFSWRRKLFPLIHKQFGGSLRKFIIGGAALRPEVGHFFQSLGIHILQGYGLTETSPVVSVNEPGRNRIGSVGRALEDVQVKILGDGEIAVKGPNVMKGYYKNEAATKEVLDADGWFHTGDIGILDSNNFLWITGRKKNLIVLSGGKKVAPEEVEEWLKTSSKFAEVCVTGMIAQSGLSSGTEQVVAIIRPHESSHSLEEIQEEATRLISQAAGHKRPARYLLYEKEFPKTTTLKVKRLELLQLLRKEGRI